MQKVKMFSLIFTVWKFGDECTIDLRIILLFGKQMFVFLFTAV